MIMLGSGSTVALIRVVVLLVAELFNVPYFTIIVLRSRILAWLGIFTLWVVTRYRAKHNRALQNPCSRHTVFDCLPVLGSKCAAKLYRSTYFQMLDVRLIALQAFSNVLKSCMKIFFQDNAVQFAQKFIQLVFFRKANKFLHCAYECSNIP